MLEYSAGHGGAVAVAICRVILRTIEAQIDPGCEPAGRNPFGRNPGIDDGDDHALH
jgi:hypothetical protein